VNNGPPPHFTFSIGNPGQPTIIYVSSDPAANHLQFSLTCTVDAITEPGTLVPPSQAGAAANSLFYVDLSPLALDPAAFSGLQVEADGWTTQLFTENGQMIGLTPAGDPIQLKAMAPVVFKIGNFVLPAAPAGVSGLELSIYNVAGVTKSALGMSAYGSVSFAAPPGGKANLGTALALTVTPSDGVVVSIGGCPVVENKLTVTLSPVQGGPVPLAGADTVFTLSVVYATDADGFGALMNAAEGEKISIPSPAGSGWETAIEDGLQGRFWTLTPTNGQPLPSSGGIPVSFDFEPVETGFQPGPTILKLNYADVPGFADGAFAFTIQKLPHVVINSFTVDPAETTLTKGVASVTASWDVSSFGTLILNFDGTDQDVTDLPSFTATISETTTFQLTATGAAPGGGDNVAIVRAIASIQPVIETFTVRPAAIFADDCDPVYPVELTWDVNTTQDVAISGDEVGTLGRDLPPSGSRQIPVGEPQKFTLTASGGTKGPTTSSIVTLQGLQLGTPQILAINNIIAGAAYSPADPLLALTSWNSAAADVSIYLTGQAEPMSVLGLVQTPGTPVFSADGTTLLIPLDLGAIALFSVTSTPAGYSIDPLSTFNSGIPSGWYLVKSVIGPDDRIYILYSCGDDQTIIVLAPTGGVYGTAGSISLPGLVSDMVLTADGVSLFAAASKGGTVWRIDVAQGGVPSGTFSTGFGEITAIDISPDGGTLLVAAAGKLTTYDVSNPGAPPTGSITVDDWKGSLAALPGGDYALVGTSGGVTLVNYARWSVAQSAGLVPWGFPILPICFAVSPDGSQALAALPPPFDQQFAILPLLDPSPPPMESADTAPSGARPLTNRPPQRFPASLTTVGEM